MKIIVGLGNPGENYKKTRHNLGAECVAAFAHKYGLVLKKEPKFHSLIAFGMLSKKLPSIGDVPPIVKEEKIALLVPLTYMNRSGLAVRKIVDFFKVSPSSLKEEATAGNKNLVVNLSDILIIVDDIYLKFETLRFRFSGSSGGHNGLKDIEAHLGSKEYPRLRMGIGPQSLPGEKLKLDVPLEHFVLDHFSMEEQKIIPQFLEKGIAAVETWLFEPSKVMNAG